MPLIIGRKVCCNWLVAASIFSHRAILFDDAGMQVCSGLKRQEREPAVCVISSSSESLSAAR